MPERWELRQMQSLPLAAKVSMTESRIREWVTAASNTHGKQIMTFVATEKR